MLSITNEIKLKEYKNNKANKIKTMCWSWKSGKNKTLNFR